MLWCRILVFRIKYWTSKVVSCLQGIVLGYDHIILVIRSPLMEKCRIIGTGHIHLVHSWCLYQILIGAFCSYWGSEAGGGERQWSSCPNGLAVRRQRFTSSSSQSCPLQSPKGTGETQRSLRPLPPGMPSFSLHPWSQAQVPVHNPQMWLSQEPLPPEPLPPEPLVS